MKGHQLRREHQLRQERTGGQERMGGRQQGAGEGRKYSEYATCLTQVVAKLLPEGFVALVTCHGWDEHDADMHRAGLKRSLRRTWLAQYVDAHRDLSHERTAGGKSAVEKAAAIAVKAADSARERVAEAVFSQRSACTKNERKEVMERALRAAHKDWEGNSSLEEMLGDKNREVNAREQCVMSRDTERDFHEAFPGAEAEDVRDARTWCLAGRSVKAVQGKRCPAVEPGDVENAIDEWYEEVLKTGVVGTLSKVRDLSSLDAQHSVLELRFDEPRQSMVCHESLHKQPGYRHLTLTDLKLINI